MYVIFSSVAIFFWIVKFLFSKFFFTIIYSSVQLGLFVLRIKNSHRYSFHLWMIYPGIFIQKLMILLFDFSMKVTRAFVIQQRQRRRWIEKPQYIHHCFSSKHERAKNSVIGELFRKCTNQILESEKFPNINAVPS